MNDVPKAGDKVRVTYETTVCREGWFFGRGFQGQSFPEVRGHSVEVIERANDPANDPIGTVRQSLDGLVYVKTPAERYPWRCAATHIGLLTIHRSRNEGVTHWPVLGRVPWFGPGAE